MRQWVKALSFGTVSVLAIVATYIWAPKDPDYAGSVFSWKITFYVPMLVLAFGSWVTALVFYVGFVRRKEPKTRFQIAMPAVLLLPLIYELGCNILLIVRLSR